MNVYNFFYLVSNKPSELKVSCLIEYNCEFGGLIKTKILKISKIFIFVTTITLPSYHPVADLVYKKLEKSEKVSFHLM